MSTSPTLPPAQHPGSAHDPLHENNSTSKHQQESTPPQPHHQQHHQEAQQQSPRRPLEQEQRDSSLPHEPTPQHTRDDNNNNNNNNNHDSTRTALPWNNRPHSPSRDNSSNNSNDQRSLSPRPHEQQRASNFTQDQSESSYGHSHYSHANANVLRPRSPQHSYYHNPARRSASPAGPSEASAQSAYYKASSSEPCREPCCVDSTRAAPYSSNSYSSSSYVAYPPGGPQAHYYSSEQTASRTQYSPDSPRTPAFSPSLPSSSSTPSPSSSSTAPYTPTTNSPVTGHHPKQGVVFHDSSRTVVSNNNNRDNGDAQRMDVDQQSSEQPKATTLTTKTAKTTSKPFKIPRPANSFMLYRAENGKKYPGLVATELSAKLGEAWRREPQEVRDRYDELAEQAKRDHALKYPGYKFAPVKRGTGKRALKLAAEAIANEMAEMDAATLLISMASMPPVPAPVAVVAAPTLSHNHDHRMYSPTSPTHTATSVSIMGTRPKAQRPFKVASLNDSNVPISNDDIANGPVSNSTTDNTGTSTLKDATPEQEPFSNGDTDAAAGRATAEAGAGASHQTSRAYPQLSPPLILFREALARRSPQLASSLVAQIVINVWLGVTDELRERYEIMAESDPRFKDKNGYIKHVPVTSGTPTTASEAMMANQIAQLLRKAAAAEQLTLPQSNKRKRTLSKSHGPGSKLARIAPAPVPISVSVSVSATKPTEHSPFRHWMDPAHVPERVEPAPARPEASSTVSTATASPVLDEAAPAPVPTKVALAPVPTKITPAPTKTAPISAPTPVSARNDLTPAAVIPMPMPSPNRRQTRASAAVVAMAGYTPPKSTSSLSPAVPAKPSKITKKVAPQSKVHKARAKNEEKATPANRPVRRIVRPSKYSA